MAKKAILAYANDQENSLKWLADEFKTISDYFRDNNTGEVDIIPLPDATLDDIRSVLQNPKVADDIILFHFSGHADPGKLFFHHEQGGRADGIAGMLSVIPSLQFVFLNGCATRDQVAALHAAGVKAVIATSRAVNDAQAAKLSKTFYASLCRHMPLGKSFDKAKGYTAAESDFTRFLPQASRSLGLDEAEGTDVPWGIYYHPELDPAGRQDVEDWIFPEHGIVAEVNVPYQPCYDFIEQIARKAGSYFAHLDEKSLNDLDKNVRAEITDLYQYYTDTYNREEYTFKILSSQVKDIMPYPLAYWFEKILSTRNNIQALEENGALPTGEYGKLLRLQIQFYQSLGKLCGLIMLSNLYDFLLRTTDLTRVQLTRGQFDCLHSFFRITPEHRDSYDYTALIKTAREILEKNDAVPFIKEYRIFKEDFRHNEQLFEAHMEISSLKYRLDNGKIPDAELKSYCRKAEGLLWEVFEKVFFIFRYKLIIIRKIEIIKYRIDKPKFVHNRVILHKAAGDTLQEDDVTLPIDGVELDPGYTDSYSVMLFRGLSDFSSYLNLSPLAIDLNILKGEEKSALYLFSHIEANGGIVYEEVQNPKNSACILVNGDGSIDYVRNLKKLPKIEKAITGKLTVLYKQFEALRNLFSALEPLARQEPETLPS